MALGFPHVFAVFDALPLTEVQVMTPVMAGTEKGLCRLASFLALQAGSCFSCQNRKILVFVKSEYLFVLWSSCRNFVSSTVAFFFFFNLVFLTPQQKPKPQSLVFSQELPT